MSKGGFLPILNYHDVTAESDSHYASAAEKFYAISRSTFESHLSIIRARGFSTLNLDELKERLQEKAHGPTKKIMITFDDGLAGQCEYALPLLAEHKMKAVFFVSSGLVGKDRYMSWSNLKGLQTLGFEIGSHGVSHIPLTHLPERMLFEELRKSKEAIEDKLGAAVRSFSVPRGFYNGRVKRKALEAGYRFVFTSRFDVNTPGESLFSLKRMAVDVRMSEEEFMRLLEGKLGFRRPVEMLKNAARSIAAPKLYEAWSHARHGLWPPSPASTTRLGRQVWL